jgi:nitrate/nitrite transport system substrate-binding protein
MAEEVVVAPGIAQQEATAQPTRRVFLTQTGQTGLAMLTAGLPRGWTGPVYASDAPETTKVRIGIMALTDCSSLVMAYELGLFKKYGIEATISKEASWAMIRDRLNLGKNQTSHLLPGMAYASTMGLMAFL